ncbi:uncharacterized protein A4U43_C01F15990 [Asparagus officinalis]|uniref:Uncharacterized protein n=1 Tax=Asparagus officinalis TaxID=4686 RepID=A0A5P1FUC2_ASPOF|nr:uncharacterized protein A4U43_C01F15990 [Asparagus officinalis]
MGFNGSSSTSPPLRNNLPPFVDRFGDIPEPVRRQMIGACLSTLRQHLERMVEEIKSLKEPCWDCVRQLEDAVMAADSLGLEGVESYWSALARCSLEFENWERERVEKENRYGRWVWLHDVINSSDQDVHDVDDDDDDGGLKIYD